MINNDKFTNKSDIEYPTFEDIADIKVLNNNTKILDNKITNIDTIIGNKLQGIAKERGTYNIENKINDISNNLNSTKFSSLAKERTAYNIENQINEVVAKLNSTKFSSLAKESTAYNIENQVRKIDSIKSDIINFIINNNNNKSSVIKNIQTGISSVRPIKGASVENDYEFLANEGETIIHFSNINPGKSILILNGNGVSGAYSQRNSQSPFIKQLSDTNAIIKVNFWGFMSAAASCQFSWQLIEFY